MIAQARTRILTALPTLAAVLVLSFVLMRVAPGGPFDGERPLDPATRAALASAYGLDRPLPVQLGRYLARLAHGDFGPSMVYRDFSVSTLVAQGLPISLTLGGFAFILALAGGIAAGCWAGLKPGSARDRAVMAAATLATALPTFVTGPLLVLVFALGLGWLPVGGWGGPGHLLLPAVALALPAAGAIARLARAGLADVLGDDFVRAARGRGLSPARVLWRHALPPALVPVANYAGPAAAGLLTGSVVIETVFALPGLGRYFVGGALNRDYPLVLAAVLIYAGLIVLFNLLADLATLALDPRGRG